MEMCGWAACRFWSFLGCFYSKTSKSFSFLLKICLFKAPMQCSAGAISMLSPGERIAKMNFLQIKHDLAILEGLGRTCPAVGSDILRQKPPRGTNAPGKLSQRGSCSGKEQPRPNSFLSPQKGPDLPGESSCELNLYFVSVWLENCYFSKKILWLNDLVNLITCVFSLPSSIWGNRQQLLWHWWWLIQRSSLSAKLSHIPQMPTSALAGSTSNGPGFPPIRRKPAINVKARLTEDAFQDVQPTWVLSHWVGLLCWLGLAWRCLQCRWRPSDSQMEPCLGWNTEGITFTLKG